MEEVILIPSVKRRPPSNDTESRPGSKKLRPDLSTVDLDSNTNGSSTSINSEIFGDFQTNVDADGPYAHLSASLDSPMWEWPMVPTSNSEAEFFDWTPEMQEAGNATIYRQQDHALEYDSYLWNPHDPEEVIYQKLKSMATLSICYGAIHNVRVKLFPHASELREQFQSTEANFETLVNNTRSEVYLFNVCRSEDGKTFMLQPPRNVDEETLSFSSIAVLNQETGRILSEIASFCTFSSYSPVEHWRSAVNGPSKAEKNTCVFVDLVIYGDQENTDSVGSILDSNKVYLQDPDYRDLRLGYKNPHFMDLKIDLKTHTDLDISQSSVLQVDTGVQIQFSEGLATTQTLLKQRITAAFKTMTRAQSLKRIAANMRVRTHLLDYQEEALDFIMQRETGLISDEYRLWQPKNQTAYCHVITSCETNEKPVEAGGGILADEMGLGKTLTMLSAIIGSTDEAKTFVHNLQSKKCVGGEQYLVPSRATLVIVPSPLLLDEWQQEISLHCTGFSDPVIYHGPGREGNASVLADSDIVLSTYHTIAAESTDTTSPLKKIHWFRIILDEAHIIRRMTTQLFKAVNKLHAKIRWCLTGTPIQNSLEDLAALVSFIRCSPLDSLQQFKKYIVSPLMKQSVKGVDNLRQLLDSICLRRTKDLLDLPEVVPETRFLALSSVEKQRYIDTRERFIKTINRHHLKPQTKSYLGVFQLQLQLRRLCNHGTYQKDSLGVEDFDLEQAMAFLKSQEKAICGVCSVNVTSIRGFGDQRSSSFTVCGHLLCAKCIPKMKQALQTVNGKDASQKCSLCPEIFSGEYLQTKIKVSSSQASQSKNSISAMQYFDKTGYSTKMTAVISDIEQYKTEGKSIIFSCWTRSLDLIGLFLESRNINFVRIDGSHSLGQRKSILDTYQKETGIKILLMTTGTGAVGLNLTVANCVYILEPQWNPMVENQAIARVNRLGQKRNVRVVRYIVKETVEEVELQAQQTRKLEYAKIGWQKA